MYSGGNKPKDASTLAAKTSLTEMAVLQLATPMANKQYFEQVRYEGRVAFRKYQHINAVKQTILRTARSAKPHKESGARPHMRQTASRPTTRSPQRSVWKSRGRRARRNPSHDVFVCHASEDKAYVDRLVAALKRADVKVWYDKDFLKWGDGLRSFIDRGLANSRYGIVVFSRAFLKRKHWTEHELNGLFAKERNGRKVILPIWHRITDRELLKYSPAFADRIAMISNRDTVSDIVENLKALLDKS